jgi:hypothetical protein
MSAPDAHVVRGAFIVAAAVGLFFRSWTAAILTVIGLVALTVYANNKRGE